MAEKRLIYLLLIYLSTSLTATDRYLEVHMYHSGSESYLDREKKNSNRKIRKKIDFEIQVRQRDGEDTQRWTNLKIKNGIIKSKLANVYNIL